MNEQPMRPAVMKSLQTPGLARNFGIIVGENDLKLQEHIVSSLHYTSCQLHF
jgi:hypothetical protein